MFRIATKTRWVEMTAEIDARPLVPIIVLLLIYLSA